MIIAILAHDPNHLIGNNKSLPWHIKEELQLFKEYTLNSTLLFGQKTVDGMGRLLPNRETIIISDDMNYTREGATVIYDVKDLLDKYTDTEDILYICGGASIYRWLIPYTDYVYASILHKEYEGNVYVVDYGKEYSFEKIYEEEHEEFTFTKWKNMNKKRI